MVTKGKFKFKKMKKMKLGNGLMIAFLGLAIGFTSCKKEGCTDPLATNYNNKANHDDGTCTYDGITPGTVLNVTENIDVPTTWAAATVKVCGSININAALTINPGVTVIMCATSSLEVFETGSINAVGTAAAPITFKGEVATKGYWEGIYIRSNNPNNQFNYVTVSDAGSYWFWEYANVCLGASAKLSMTNSTISNSERVGLFADESATFPAFANNTFSNNGTVGLNLSVRQLSMIDGASNYNLSNGEAFIFARGGTISSNQTWQATTTPILINGTLDVDAGLTINPGASLLMESEAAIHVNATGYLSAVGTASSPISIVGRYASSGYWEGVNFESNNPNNKMAYVTLRDAGSYWFYDYTTVTVEGRLEMDNCTISNSNSWAVIAYASSTMICGGATQTDAAGVTAFNTITGNGTGPDADCVGGGCTVLFE